MSYSIHQLNNKFNRSDNDLKTMKVVYATISSSFKGPLETSDFQHLEMQHYEDYTASTQFFYLTAENGDIVSVVEIVPRQGLHQGTLNLLLTMVFTNPDYRKRGLVAKLINWVINFYETGTTDFDGAIKLADCFEMDQCREYISLILPEEIVKSEKIHWTLYSIVGEYYARFGFNPCNDTEWIELCADNFDIDFELKEDTEKLLTMDNIPTYFTAQKYNLPHIEDERFNNCALEEATFPGFVQRYQSYLNLNGLKEEFSEHGKYCGFLISGELDASQKTIAFICPFFFMNRIVIPRVYTNVRDKNIFKHHWERISKFAAWYAKQVWATIPNLSDYEDADKVLMVTSSDFVSETLTRQEFADVITSTGGWENRGQGIVLPMIRDWKLSRKPPSRLAHSGYWSFM